MKTALLTVGVSLLLSLSNSVAAEPAVKILGHDFTFPAQLADMPHKLSDFSGLQINTFATNDGVKLAY